MDTSNHYTLHSLFKQLGLPAEGDQIEAFIQTHSLGDQEKITQAKFWTKSQAHFLKESIIEDSDWVEIIDHLDVQLRHR